MIMVVQILIVCVIALAVLYLLMIMPKLTRNPQRGEFEQWLYAHRGLHDNEGDAPENSMAAFRKAVEAGYGIEMDIQLSKDGIPVVFHDFTLKRVCGAEGRVCDYTLEELQGFSLYKTAERIPTLSRVLELVAGKVPLIVEFKIERTDLSLCPAADKLLRAYGGLYCMESFNPLGVLWYRRNHREIMRGQLSEAFLQDGNNRGLLYFLLQNLMFNFICKPDFIAYNHIHAGIWARRICRKVFGNLAVAWTVRSREELAAAGKSFDIFIFDSFVPEDAI